MGSIAPCIPRIRICSCATDRICYYRTIAHSITRNIFYRRIDGNSSGNSAEVMMDGSAGDEDDDIDDELEDELEDEAAVDDEEED